MDLYKAYKFRIYPNAEQETQINRTFGCCRFVYNHFLAEWLEKFKATGKMPTKRDPVKAMLALKEQNEWLKEADGWGLSASIDNLDFAFRRYLGEYKNVDAGHPRFKTKRDHHQSYKTTAEHIKFSGKTVKLPKLGFVKCRISKTVQGTPLNAVISRNAGGKYFVSIICGGIEATPLPATGSVVGVDCGLRDFAVTSNGEKYPNPKWYVKSEKKLARLQRQLSRKTKDSKRWEKARIEVARLNDHVANQRRDFQQKLSTQLIRENDIICIESLPSSELAGEHRLAKAVYDAAWFSFKRQLQYKAEWHGRQFVETRKYFPSNQICSECGDKATIKITPDDIQWTCPHCGAVHDRCINAAKNILKEGLCQLA